MTYILYDPDAPVIKPKRNTAKIVFTDEQRQWLIDNYPTTLNRDLAAHLGISESSVHRWARLLGVKKDPDWFHGLVLERCALMARLNRGEGNNGKNNLAILGEKTRFRKGQTNRERYGEENERRRIQRATESRRETVRKERMRVRWGLPQETKLRVIRNRPATELRYTLKRHGYIIPHRGATTVYYDASTNRRDVLEQHAAALNIQVLSVEVLRASGSHKQQ